MKINVRLLLITFSVIVIISLSSTFIYYSTTTSLLKKQYSKSLINAAHDFNFEFQSGIKIFEEEFSRVFEYSKNHNLISLDTTNLDFVFTLDKNNAIDPNFFFHSQKLQPPAIINSIEEFIRLYPNIIFLYTRGKETQNIFYGKLLTEEYLNDLSNKIRAEITFVAEDLPTQITHSEANEKYLVNFINAINSSKEQSKPGVFYEELKSSDFFSVFRKPEYLSAANISSSFIIFNTPAELSEFRDTIQLIIFTFALAGVFLSLIFVLLFTTKLRKQISLLSKTTNLIAEGNLSERVPIVTKDELGQLGSAFNEMLDRIETKEKNERRYLDIVTIINEHPSIDDLSNKVLEKIISATETSFGAFYLVDEDELELVCAKGIGENSINTVVDRSMYSNVIQTQEIIEMTFQQDFPSIKMGLLEINIKYLLVIPIIFDKKVIAVIEIASENIPSIQPKDYLESIKKQLAIGINNSASLEQLKSIVEELKILNDQYQEQNVELTKLHADLKEKAEELEEQRRKAVELTHVKSQFLANMSHELRTPLNSIIGLTELISDDSTTFPKTKDRLKIVLRNGKKLLALINNILEFSKIESGKFEVTKSDFIISEFMNDVFQAMEPLVTEKDLQLSIVFENNRDLLVNSDRHKLEQIILNLISNAIKFTEIGGIKINVSDTLNDTLRIDVIDTGIGITDENKKLIFEEFKQVEHTNTKKFQGAGLGLAICKKYVSLLGGEISVQSNDFKGSTFTILLTNSIQENLPLLEEYRYPQSSVAQQKNRKKILLIHDDDRNKISVENYFETSEYDVVQSKPNAELIEQLGDVPLDGIILNTNNITNSYWDILYSLKINHFTGSIPISLIGLQQDGERAYILDVFEFIVGSDNFEKLRYVLDLIKLKNNRGKRILWLGDETGEKGSTIEKFSESAEIITVSEIQNIVENIEELKPDVLIIDLIAQNKPTIKLMSYLKETSDIPIIVSIPKVLDDLTKQKLITDFDDMLNDNSKELEETLRIIDRKFSIMNKLKKSISFPIENKLITGDEEGAEALSSITNENMFHVLVVDDDKDTLFTVGEILKNIGCSISFAHNGAECLTLLKSSKPDLILLDIRMPIMDGFETMKKIRADQDLKDLKVYAMTAQAMLDDFEIIKQNGFDDLITKPIDNSTLSFKIQQRIQQIKVV